MSWKFGSASTDWVFGSTDYIKPDEGFIIISEQLIFKRGESTVIECESVTQEPSSIDIDGEPLDLVSYTENEIVALFPEDSFLGHGINKVLTITVDGTTRQLGVISTVPEGKGVTTLTVPDFGEGTIFEGIIDPVTGEPVEVLEGDQIIYFTETNGYTVTFQTDGWPVLDVDGNTLTGSETIKFQLLRPGSLLSNVVTLTALDYVEENDPPVWDSTPDINGIENTPFSHDVSIYASDVNDDDLTFEKVSGDDGIDVSPAGLVTGTITDQGNYPLVISVTDGKSDPVNGTFSVVIAEQELPPVWDEDIPDLTGVQNSPLSIDISVYASDYNSDELTFALVYGDSALSVSETGLLTGTLTTFGTFPLEISVTDGKSSPVSNTFSLVITEQNFAPVWDSTPDLEGVQNTAFSFDVSGYASDANGDDLEFAKVSGDSNVSVSPEGIVSGTMTSYGEFDIVISVTDNKSTPVEGTFKLILTEQALPPIWDTIPDFEEKTNVSFSHDISSYATDPNDDELTFIKVSGDSRVSVSPSGVVSGTIDDKGTFNFVVSVTDNVTEPVTQGFAIIVGNEAPSWSSIPDIEIDQGDSISVDISTYAEDPEEDSLIFSKVSGHSGISISSSGLVTGTISEPGTQVIEVSAYDGYNDPVSTTFNIVVDNKPPVWSDIPDIEVKTNAVISSDISGYVTDTESDDLTFLKTSGDSRISISEQGIVSGTISDIGTFTIGVSVSDGHNDAVETTFDIVVENKPPVWSNIPTINTNPDSSINRNISGYVTDSEGDDITFTKTSGDAGIEISESGVVTGSIDSLGTFVIGVTASDGINDPVATTFTINVQEAGSGELSEWMTFLFSGYAEIAKQFMVRKLANNVAGVTCVYTGKNPYSTTIMLFLDRRSGSLSAYAVKFPDFDKEDRVDVNPSDIEEFFLNSDVDGLREYLYNLFH